MILEWWYWVVFGLCLAVAEIMIPVFFVIWFGLGALFVGLVLLMIPELSVAAQVLIWTALSSVLAGVWFRHLKPKTRTVVGTSASVIGEVGVLVGDLSPDSRGQVRFQKPVMGSDNWECYAEQNLQAGERVRIVAVEGSFIKVEKAKSWTSE